MSTDSGDAKPKGPALPELPKPEDKFDREELRKRLAALGIELPVNEADVSAIAKKLADFQAQANEARLALAGTPESTSASGTAGSLGFKIPNPDKATALQALDDLQKVVEETGAKFQDYARQVFQEPVQKYDREDLRAQLQGFGLTLPKTESDVLTLGKQLAELQAKGAAPEKIKAAQDALGAMAHDVYKNKPAFDQVVTKQALEQIGITLPTTAGDVSTVSKRLFELQQDPNANPRDVAAAQELFQKYAFQWNRDRLAKEQGKAESGPRTSVPVEQAVHDLRQTTAAPRANTPRLPSPTEFLSDFNNAFDTALSSVTGRAGNGSLSSAESDYAARIMRPRIMAKYTGAMGRLAAAGQSPYQLTDTATGGAVSTDIFGGSSGAANRAHQQGQAIMAAGAGIGGDVVAAPKIMPLDFITSELDPRIIKTMYEQDQQGAGQHNREAPVTARRV